MLRVINGNRNAQDEGESQMVADSSNTTVAVFNSPVVASFDTSGVLYITNAGAGAGTSAISDAIYRIVENEANHLFQPASAITRYVSEHADGTGFGVGPNSSC